MHGRFHLLTKVQAMCLEEMREIVVNKIYTLLGITDAKLMAVLTATKEERSVSLNKGISDTTAAAKRLFLLLILL